MRRDNRGITLVEMIIAIAACVIVISAASLFIRNALRGYGLAANAVDLQIEAQVLMEQFSTWVMEGNYVLNDTVDGFGEVFIIYHIPRKVPDSGELLGERWMRVFLCDGNGMFMYELEDDEFEDPTTEKSNLNASSLSEENRHLLSKYVEDFNVTVEKDSKGLPSMVKVVKLTMRAGIQTYELAGDGDINIINIRNASYVPTESPQPTETPVPGP